jgi:hypothetical protein
VTLCHRASAVSDRASLALAWDASAPTAYRRRMEPDRGTRVLRRAVLAVTLTEPGAVGDLETRERGLLLEGTADRDALEIPWGELVLAGGDPGGVLADGVVQRRVGRWLRLRLSLHERLCLDGVDAGRAWVVSRTRPRALPVEHDLHPGPSWPQRTVLGGALDYGLALRGVDDDGRPDPEAVGLMPAGLLLASGIDVQDAGSRADRYLTDMAALAADRLRRDPTATLRPLGDADVLTLLASRTLRRALVDGQGMRSAAIPSRTRGWLDLGRLDPAFAVTAAQLTEPDERGFCRPVLITADEVVLVKPGGDAVRQSLADPAPQERAQPASRLA